MNHISIIIFIVGIFSGFLNTVASCGSAIVLPAFLFLGIPPTVSNGTNRIAIFAGSAIAVCSFAYAGKIQWKRAIQIAIPTAIGTIIGANLATALSPKKTFYLILIAIIL